MFQNILRTLDIFIIILSVMAAVSLWMGGSSVISILLIVLSPALLLFAKYKRNRLLLFAAYSTTTVYFTAILYNGLTDSSVDFFQSEARVLLYGLAAILVSIIAAVVGFGTNTLTILWLSFYILVIFETVTHYPLSSFLDHFWSRSVIEDAVRKDYPFLLMVIWIGLFLDKYQRELTRDYLTR
ncbi:hypothetical protein [Bacillus massiliglaciei]|uniref:hypothetical protein n=1 Tax=Bacillus massiliglaciei TaxID=1816693 RepID=UPI000DA6367A|nr:hypothetical protein [Bacillus massiliglaciei]